VGQDGALRRATGLAFRHGAAVQQPSAGVPRSEVHAQRGHARVDTTTISTRLTNAERGTLAAGEAPASVLRPRGRRWVAGP
jgi:hypothetical protein